MQITLESALKALESDNQQQFLKVMEHGSMTVEIYRPEKVDLQKPHQQDELYVVISGSGYFINDGNRIKFKAGDILFVGAGIEHRFVNFTDNFSTWVIFYGAVGGEK